MQTRGIYGPVDRYGEFCSEFPNCSKKRVEEHTCETDRFQDSISSMAEPAHNEATVDLPQQEKSVGITEEEPLPEPKPKKEEEPSKIKNFFKWLWDTITFKKKEEVKQVDELDEVKKKDLEKLLNEMRELLTQLKKSVEENEASLEEDRHKTEFEFFKLMILAIRLQQQLKEEEIAIGKDALLEYHDLVVEIRDSYFQLQKIIDDNNKTSSIVGKISNVIMAVILTTTTAALGISVIITAGATAPAAIMMAAKTGLFIAGAGLSVAGGGTQLLNAYLSKKDGELKAQATMLQHERTLSNKQIKEFMNDISDYIKRDLQLVDLLRIIIENDQKAKNAQLYI